MAIPASFIQELIARADVVDIVGRYVQLKKGGANFMGLCPFHGEKSPSFSVSPTKQFYHCFGCGKNGNAISFLMDHAGMTFIEAVKDLAQQYGMQIPEDEASPEDRARAQEQRQKQTTLTDVLEKAGEAYRKHLKDSPRAVAYFKGRGLSGQVAKQFGLGYAPEGWRSLASVFAHYDDPLLVESGLVISNVEDGSTEEKRYDRFRDRVMFPIRNIKGECIGFGGRVLGDDKPKYLNSPETPVFSKGRELYGLFEARNALREAGYVLVTEGYMDVVALAQLGFPNAVATLGTACTAEHVHKLFRFTDAVVFSFDGDSAGRRAARCGSGARNGAGQEGVVAVEAEGEEGVGARVHWLVHGDRVGTRREADRDAEVDGTTIEREVADRVLRRDADDVLDLLDHALGVGGGQVDLVEHRDHLDPLLGGGVAVRDRLRLDALRRVDDEQRALAGRERARHLVGEVDVARRVDQVQPVGDAVARLVGQRRGLRLDRDAALALEVHRVEHLRLHLAILQATADLDETVGERRLAVVDVRND